MCGRWGGWCFGAQYCNAFCGDSTVAHFARKVRGAKVGASALKGQPVQSPGQRPGYQCINAYAL